MNSSVAFAGIQKLFCGSLFLKTNPTKSLRFSQAFLSLKYFLIYWQIGNLTLLADIFKFCMRLKLTMLNVFIILHQCSPMMTPFQFLQSFLSEFDRYQYFHVISYCNRTCNKLSFRQNSFMRKIQTVNNYLVPSKFVHTAPKFRNQMDPSLSTAKDQSHFDNYFNRPSIDSGNFDESIQFHKIGRAKTSTDKLSDKIKIMHSMRENHQNQQDLYPSKITSNSKELSQIQTVRSASTKRSNQELEYELTSLITQLKDVKMILEEQLVQFQRLLDQTQSSLTNIDLQFNKIKFRILEYTSNALDSAFTTYKQKMKDWHVYESIEKKGLEVLLEAREYIQLQQHTIDLLRNNEIIQNIADNNVQVDNHIQHYQFVTQEIKKIRQECFLAHPILKQNKIVDFERSVLELCTF